MKKYAIAIICISVIIAMFLFLLKFLLMPKNNTVEIVFTTDKYYKDYLITTINSAIANKKESSIYNIHILCVDLSEKDIEKFEKLAKNNVNIYPMPLKLETIKDLGKYKVDYHVTRADLFKFFMPQLFPELDKILYIDVDTVILKDLTELYNTRLGNKYLGAVNKCIPYKIEKKIWKIKFTKKIFKYNCGVMLLNLKKFREDNMTEKLIVSKNNKQYKNLMTQQTFNDVIGQDKIVHLSPIYNTFVQWDEDMFILCHFKQVYWKFCMNINSSEDLFKKAVIIHYLDDNKPWSDKDVLYKDLWLKYRQ